jgi:predicted Zn-dependent protease
MPGDPAMRNNFSQIALLLKVETVGACGMARDLHEAHPHDAAYPSTYAFGLFQSGDVKAAIKTMSQLTPEQLHDPAIAAYYGIFLAAAGYAAAAREYFELAEEAKLLPEEQNLVAQAKATLARQ